MKLTDYRRKRNAGLTNEPFGGDPQESVAATNRGAFVVHLHDATNLHYDLRLEMGGVLSSFAVPKGPSLDPEEKKFAAHTEDHPLEYLDFEDVIPPGQYGAGPMIVWDRGGVQFLDGTAEDGVARGKLDFVLNGYKLFGRFALVRMKSGAKDWLLIKKADAYSRSDRDIIVERPHSVLSGLLVTELPERKAIGRALEKAAATAKAKEGAAFGLSIVPMMAREVSTPVSGEAWLHELALGGVRVIATKTDDEATTATVMANERDMGDLFPEVARAVQALAPERVVLDGEVVAFEDGRPSASLLERRIREGSSRDINVVCMVSDVLAIGARDLRKLPLLARKALLTKLLPAPGVLRATEYLEGEAGPLVAFCKEHDLDGIISKKRSSSYHAGPKPSDAWCAQRVTSRTRGAPIAPPPPAAPVKRVPRFADPRRGVTVTNRGKIFWPDEGYTKGDLCDYYEAIAETLLPYLRDRPIAIVRYPDGIAGKNFYQWNVPPGMPGWMQSLELREREENERKRVFLVNDAASLLYVANLGCIPIHVLACQKDTLDACDFLTIDFDLKQAKLEHAIVLANVLHDLLDTIGLEGFPKSSGQSGLHVLVPLGKGISFITARALADLLGRLLVARHPDIATMERIISKRGDKVYVDTGQTGPTRTIASPYSVRAQPGATVSTPLEWGEVTTSLDPRAFTIRTVPARVAKMGDPMRALLDATPDVPAAIERLAPLVKV